MEDVKIAGKVFMDSGVRIRDCILLFYAISLIFLVGCTTLPEEGGGNMTSEKKYVRESVIAGSWYPESKDALSRQLEGFFSKAEKQELGRIKALVVPHAGYAYSGQVAAHAFKQIEGGDYDTVIILAPSHHYPLDGVSISNYTHYKTPLGEVKISSLAKKLREESKLISTIPDAHSKEHSAEIEIPFLQYSLKEFEIVPVIVGRMSRDEIDEFSDLIIKHLDERTLIVASTDLSHYHPYNEALTLDNYCVESIVALDDAKAEGCEMCGYFPVLVTMEIAEKLNWSTKLLKYMNSGDVTGDRSGVVGYASIAFYSGEEKPGEELSEKQKKYLLEVARDTVELYVGEGKKFEPKTDDPKLREKKGVFVTLEKNGQLRGCIGHLEPIQPLYLDVRDNAINAAFNDPRFSPVTANELDDIEIEVSVLTLPELITADSPEEYLERIQPGVDGIILDYKGRGATYLPQVWEQIPEKEDFLSSLCNKAFLPSDCWRKPDVKIYRYKVIAFKESDFR
ncbi:MAG: AmmeMemoRadiSam system protein B [Candidatus Altiarchaeota archaeon]|nr:AmmeMemoRadiSam system protein B [Candidatus Altiarchaeota archaeon]